MKKKKLEFELEIARDEINVLNAKLAESESLVAAIRKSLNGLIEAVMKIRTDIDHSRSAWRLDLAAEIRRTILQDLASDETELGKAMARAIDNMFTRTD